ncbi:unnamed protein product [Phytophthora fragariaefolia]|uniref:Unnamed protein product n=1 Tax=Phytophthora fragariaefolia TaxID=1490495 RepID=A0A9W7D0X7_9STRA|nr:unnamed protein product [Phytophthora fragariaefolia]
MALVDGGRDELALHILVLPAAPLEPHDVEHHVEEAQELRRVHGQQTALRVGGVPAPHRGQHGLHDHEGCDKEPDSPEVPPDLLLLLLGAAVHGPRGDEPELVGQRKGPRGHGEEGAVPEHEQRRDQRVVRDLEVQHGEDPELAVAVGQQLGGLRRGAQRTHDPHEHVHDSTEAEDEVAREEDEEEPAHARHLQVPRAAQAEAGHARGHARRAHADDGQRRPRHRPVLLRMRFDSALDVLERRCWVMDQQRFMGVLGVSVVKARLEYQPDDVGLLTQQQHGYMDICDVSESTTSTSKTGVNIDSITDSQVTALYHR